MKQVIGHSAPIRDAYNVLDSVEPDPIGFRDQVGIGSSLRLMVR